MRIKPVKITAIILTIIAVLLVTVFFGISPLAKYVIEKNSEQWTGRKITIEHLFINLWRWDVTVKGIKVYEQKSNKQFFSAEKIYTDISILKAISGEYQVNTIQVEGPKVMIEQNGNQFNFDDLVTRFTAADTTLKEPEKQPEPTKYRIERIEITNGTITYKDLLLKNEIVMQQFKMGCPLLVWNSPMLNAATEFNLNTGGKTKANILLNLDSLSYSLHADIEKLNLRLLVPYLKDIHLQCNMLYRYILPYSTLQCSLFCEWMHPPQEILPLLHLSKLPREY